MRTEGVSNRLTHYPAELLTQSLADTRVEIVATPGGAELPSFVAPDAQPLPGVPDVAPATSSSASAGRGTAEVAAAVPAVVPAAAGTGAGNAASTAATVPGGVSSGDLPSIFRTADVTPLVLSSRS